MSLRLSTCEFARLLVFSLAGSADQMRIECQNSYSDVCLSHTLWGLWEYLSVRPTARTLTGRLGGLDANSMSIFILRCLPFARSLRVASTLHLSFTCLKFSNVSSTPDFADDYCSFAIRVHALLDLTRSEHDRPSPSR